MNIVCLDLEGVLVPEIWVEFAKESGIAELEKTTRDEPDYDKLMKYRLDVLKQHGMGLKEIQQTIEKIERVTPEDIQRVARETFRPTNRTAVYIETAMQEGSNPVLSKE